MITRQLAWWLVGWNELQEQASWLRAWLTIPAWSIEARMSASWQDGPMVAMILEPAKGRHMLSSAGTVTREGSVTPWADDIIK